MNTSPQPKLSPYRVADDDAGENGVCEEAVAAAISIREQRNAYRHNDLVGMYDGEEAIERSIRILQDHKPEQGSLRIAMFDITNTRVLNHLDQALERGCKVSLVMDEGQYISARKETRDLIHG